MPEADMGEDASGNNRRPGPSTRTSGGFSPRFAQVPVLVIGLLLFAGSQYWHALGMPFVNDDYLILDRVRFGSFAQVWSFSNVFFGWWRPFSRELHYWLLAHEF